MNNGIAQLRRCGAEMLRAAGIENPMYEARLLLEHFCGVSQTDIVLNREAPADSDRAEAFLSACRRRAAFEPLQYIIGFWEFMGLKFKVNESVLIPRADTETLVEYILEKYEAPVRILDMCCGSGCIGLSLKAFLPNSDITLADISEDALSVAQENAKALGLSAKFVRADVMRGCEEYFDDGSFDIIVSNPPYIKSADMPRLAREVLHEPRIALDGGEDGLKFYRALALDWERALKRGGEMIFEAGFDTSGDVYSLFLECGYCDVVKRRDMNGINRLVAGKRGSWE